MRYNKIHVSRVVLFSLFLFFTFYFFRPFEVFCSHSLQISGGSGLRVLTQVGIVGPDGFENEHVHGLESMDPGEAVPTLLYPPMEGEVDYQTDPPKCCRFWSCQREKTRSQTQSSRKELYVHHPKSTFFLSPFIPY